jgi:DNA uptake protein ComE-like DNA-binding protein
MDGHNALSLLCLGINGALSPGMTMRLLPFSRTTRGFVLITVMGALAALFIMALSLGTAGRAALAGARRWQAATAAEFLAKAGIEWAQHYVHELERDATLWQTPWYRQEALFRQRSLATGVFDVTYTDAVGVQHYGLQDEEARLNMMIAPAESLARLPGVDAVLAAAMVAARQRQPWATPEDVVTRGVMSPGLFYGTAEQSGVAPYVTVWGSGKINLNTAPTAVLATVPGFSVALAEAIVRYRDGADQEPWTPDDEAFQTVADLQRVAELTPEALRLAEPWLTVVPTAFRMTSTGRVRLRANTPREHRHSRLAIVDLTAHPRIRFWRRLD